MEGGADTRRGQFDETAVALMDQVYSTALYLARNREEAEDLVQETYLRAYRLLWDSFTLGTNCKAWLMTILHNVFRNRYRDRQREQRTIEYDDNLIDDRHADESGESPSDNPEELVLSRLLDSEIEEALKDLPSEFLAAIVLVDLQELSYEEAADALDCPIGTVRSRLSRGRRLLSESLRGYARERGFIADER